MRTLLRPKRFAYLTARKTPKVAMAVPSTFAQPASLSPYAPQHKDQLNRWETNTAQESFTRGSKQSFVLKISRKLESLSP